MHFVVDKDGIPGTPTIVKVLEESSEHLLQWKAPQDPNGHVVSYDIDIQNTNWKKVVFSFLLFLFHLISD